MALNPTVNLSEEFGGDPLGQYRFQMEVPEEIRAIHEECAVLKDEFDVRQELLDARRDLMELMEDQRPPGWGEHFFHEHLSPLIMDQGENELDRILNSRRIPAMFPLGPCEI